LRARLAGLIGWRSKISKYMAGAGDSTSGHLGSLGWQAVLPTRAEWRSLLPTLVFIVVTLVSARFAAADYALDAMRYVIRVLAAALFLLVGLRLGRDLGHVRAVLWALALGAGVSGLLGFGEAVRLAPLTPLLELFKVAPTRVGGALRVSGSFQYATIAAMYFEMVAPLAIVLAATSRRRSVQVLWAGIAMICTANVVLSLTRAGMLTLLTIYAVLLVMGCVRSSLRRMLWPTLAAAVTLVGGAALLFVHDPVFDLRLQTESDADWYAAVYSAPATLSLQADRSSVVDLDVRNQGRIAWTSSGNHPFALGYRWLTDDGSGVLEVTPVEVPLVHDVEPGETIHLRADVAVPDLPAGSYRLDWGMLQRDVLQFYERGWADAETPVSIAPSASGGAMPMISPRDDEEAPWVVGRTTLWGAAARLFAEHPLLGVGPDNFRHYYGVELGLEAWDERVQANNVYLEVLADLGLLGLAAFVWVVVGPLVAAWRVVLWGPRADGDGVAAAREGAGAARQRGVATESVDANASLGTTRGGANDPVTHSPGRPCDGTPRENDRVALSGPGGGTERVQGAETNGTGGESSNARELGSAVPLAKLAVESGRGLRAYLALGVGLSILGFLLHGLLDSFLAFNPTAWLFWLLLGFASVLGAGRPD
jgi:hypothetical protein